MYSIIVDIVFVLDAANGFSLISLADDSLVLNRISPFYFNQVYVALSVYEIQDFITDMSYYVIISSEF